MKAKTVKIEITIDDDFLETVRDHNHLAKSMDDEEVASVVEEFITQVGNEAELMTIFDCLDIFNY
jgi:hypothetical protein